MSESQRPPEGPRWRSRTYDIIFLADTPAGKTFDITLIAAIVLSVVVVMLDSVSSISATYGDLFRWAEWIFTLLFSIEYVLRLATVRRSSRYAFSFFGIVDLLAVLPTYLSLLFPGGQYLIVIRILRVLRVFRVLKLARFVGEASVLRRAMWASRYKITVFLFTVMTIVVVVGSLMFLLEAEHGEFTSIPRGVYWAIVTLTTVGYGDIAPVTPMGQALASLVMIMGYGIIAVPTGIVTVELAREARRPPSRPSCPGCGAMEHEADAVFCRHCGNRLESGRAPSGPALT